MATSTIPAFKAALFTQLKARQVLAANNVQIAYGMPTAPQQDLLALLDVEGEQGWAALGRLGREERYTLTIVISVLRSGGEQQTASEQALTYAAEIESELRGNVTMNATVRTCELLTPWRLRERAFSADEREAQIEFGVYVTARI